MKFGLTEKEYLFIQNTVQYPIERAGGKIFIFGSRARGDHRRFSDLDVMVESDKNLFQLLGKIEDTLIESDFPYKVDLVERRLFSKSYLAGYLNDRIRFE